jgi:hypothetical protein
MRKPLVFALLAGALACSTAEPTGPSTVPEAPLSRPFSRVSLSGTATDVVDGRPVPRVRVQVVDTDRFVFSDDAGHYTLAELEPGTVKLQFTSSEYRDLLRTEVVQANATLDVQLERKGLILSGRIATQWGEPIGDVGIEVLRDGRVAGGGAGTGGAPGTYRIATLAAGDYVVRTVKWGYVPQQRSVTLTGDATLDFVLDRTRVSISGAVREAAPCSGTVQNARVEIVSGPDGGIGTETTVNGYQLKNVNWGAFRFRASKAGYVPAEVSMDVLLPGSSCFSCPFVNAPTEVQQDFVLQRNGSC